MANFGSIWLGSWSRRNRINVELNGVWIIHRLHVQIFSDHIKEFQFPIYKNCFGRIDKQEQICSQKCLSKRFSKVGNKSEVNRLGVKIVEDSGSQLVSRLVFGDKPDSQAERTRYSSSSSSSSSSLFWLLLLSSTSSAEPIYSSSTCHGSRHLQRDHTWLHITDSCLVTETKTTESVAID